MSRRNKQKQKVKLRTSLDVYHRLIHDRTLPIDSSNVLIGYTDGKFKDMQHMPLHEWTMIDKGGDIPMHHIVYFKYKDIILWDKRIRLDRLYGSGNTTKAQLLRQVLKETNTETYTYDEEKSICSPLQSHNKYPPNNGKITANPRQETCTDSKLNKKGIKIISYIYSFGIIGYRFHGSKPLYVVIQQRGNKEWGFPKGRYEPGEHCNGYDTAKREFEEESGIAFNDTNVKTVDWENPFISEYSYKRRDKWVKKWTVLFAAELTKNANPIITRQFAKEISGIKWMSSEQFNQKNRHREYRDIMTQLNNKLMSQISADSTINNINITQETKEETQESNSVDTIVTQLLSQLDHAINFLSSKLELDIDTKSETDEKEDRQFMIDKQARKKRLQYLMKKEQTYLWNIYKTRYNYIIPKTINEFKPTFEKQLSDINHKCLDIFNANPIKYEDIYFIFSVIFSKRKPDTVDTQIRRTKSEWNAMFPRYPMDKDNYGVAYEYNDEKTWLPMLHKYGFVLISKVLSSDECDKTVSAMFQDFNKRNKKDLRIDINDYQTWDNKYWPSPKRKFLTDCPAFHKQAFKNRFNKKIEYVFSKIFNTHRLNVSIDNWGFQRPLKIYTESKECIVNKKWQYSLKPHWDYSPWLFVQEMERLKFNPGYQGIIALNDHNLETGCHRNLPGCVDFMPQWTKEHRYPYSDKVKYTHYNDANMTYLRKSERPKKGDEIVKYLQSVPMRKGDFVIWSWGSLHGNTPNTGDKWRFVQYVRMFPAPCVHENYAKHDRYGPQRILNNKGFKEILFGDQFYKNMETFCRQLHLTKREKCLLGMEKW